MDDMKRAAQEAAELVKQLKTMRGPALSDRFQFISAFVGIAYSDIHVDGNVLAAISDKDKWVWECVKDTGGQFSHFRAKVELWGVCFKALFDMDVIGNEPVEAAEYGCPDSVLNQYCPF